MPNCVLLIAAFIGFAVAGKAQAIRWFEASPEARLFVVHSEPTVSFEEGVDRLERRAGHPVNMAMNGGMFHADGAPVGLLVEEGTMRFPLNLESGKRGNFFLLPNGVFGQDEQGAFHVITAEEAQEVVWQEATQSGPMLLIDGRPHSAFNRASENKHIRNGVGVRPDGSVVFGVSTVPINLYGFAEAFLMKGCQEALYLDGAISRMHVFGDGAPDEGGVFSVMIGVLDPAQ
jgi:uncharacterized protein YigE (DUF2233 family)